MPNDPILHLLGLAKKAGRLEVGEEPAASCGWKLPTPSRSSAWPWAGAPAPCWPSLT